VAAQASSPSLTLTVALAMPAASHLSEGFWALASLRVPPVAVHAKVSALGPASLS
jgi:hypothetical protein